MTRTAALAEFPELSRLDALRSAGWSFIPMFDRDERLVEVRGVRTWPDGSADAVLIRYITDAAGLRVDPAGGIVWQRDGDLAEIVDGLLALPAPGADGAPRLVKGAGPALWTP
jgi:hypothetical protein